LVVGHVEFQEGRRKVGEFPKFVVAARELLQGRGETPDVGHVTVIREMNFPERPVTQESEIQDAHQRLRDREHEHVGVLFGHAQEDFF